MLKKNKNLLYQKQDEYTYYSVVKRTRIRESENLSFNPWSGVGVVWVCICVCDAVSWGFN